MAIQNNINLIEKLGHEGFEILKFIQEYVAFDSRLELDRGW